MTLKSCGADIAAVARTSCTASSHLPRRAAARTVSLSTLGETPLLRAKETMEERATVRLEDMREIAAFARLNHRRKEVLAELADAEVRRSSLAACRQTATPSGPLR